MNLQELNLINPNNKNIKIIVLNNSSLGNTFLGTLNTFGKTYGNEKKYRYSPPDVKSISKGFNLTYFKIKKTLKSCQHSKIY